MPELQGAHRNFNEKMPEFDMLALHIFGIQAEQNPVYKAYLAALNIDVAAVDSLDKIPFLPIGFFKTHEVKTGDFEPVAVFESSGTTGSVPSRHYIKDISIYEQSLLKGFEQFYGPIGDWCILGLLPSYLERKNSSLVYMVERLIRASRHASSGFYLDEWEKLSGVLKELEEKKQKTLLIGVSFALLDLAEKFPLPLQHTIVMETGGMKGRREEMVRAELHERLKNAFGVSSIHSEYGMTELLAQAYSPGEGIFHCPEWMKILVRDEEDPFLIRSGGSGVINVIDLVNRYSCAFIATDDVGKLHPDGSFEVLGRLDGSDLRGCSLLTV